MRTLLVVFLISLTVFTYSQKNRQIEVDSLNKIVNDLERSGSGKNLKTDTLLLKNLHLLSRALYNVSKKEAKHIASRTIKLADSLYLIAKTIPKKFYKKSIASSYNALSILLRDDGNLDSSLVCLYKFLENTDIADYQNKVVAYTSLSFVYSQKGDSKMSVECLFKALKISEDNKYPFGIASAYQKLSNFYCYQNKFNDALPYMEKCVKIREELGDPNGLVSDYNNLANIYGYMKRFKESFQLLSKALDISRKNSIYGQEALTLNNLAYYYMDVKEYENAFKSAKAGFELRRKIGDNEGALKSMVTLSTFYQVADKNANAIKILNEALLLAKQMNNLLELKDIYKDLSTAHYNSRNYQLAFDNLSNYNIIKDSILNETISEQTTEMQTKYESEKKEQQNQLLQVQNQLSTKTINDQKTFSYFIITGLLLALGLAFFIFRGLKQQRIANKIISDQKKIVEQQKELVEEHQKEVLDSIRYAKRIQTALITNEKYIEKSLNKLQNKG